MNEKAKREVQSLIAQTEVFLNEQRAELATYSALLQCFLLNTLRSGGPGLLTSLRDQTLETLSNMQPSSDPDGDARTKPLTQALASDFLRPSCHGGRIWNQRGRSKLIMPRIG